MSEGIKTVQGGRRRVPKTPPPKPKWIWPVIGLIVGILILILWQQCSGPAGEEPPQPPPPLVGLEFETSPFLKVIPVKDNEPLSLKDIRSLRLLNSSDEVAFDRETGEVFLCEELAGLTVVFKALIAVDGDEEEVESKSVKLGSFKQDDRANCGNNSGGGLPKKDPVAPADIIIEPIKKVNCGFSVKVFGVENSDVKVSLDGKLGPYARWRSEYRINELKGNNWNVYVTVKDGEPIKAFVTGQPIDKREFPCEPPPDPTEIIAAKQLNPCDDDVDDLFIEAMENVTGKSIDNFILIRDGDRLNHQKDLSLKLRSICKKVEIIEVRYDEEPPAIYLKSKGQ